MNVLIADDHTIVRKGLIELIEEADGIKVVAEASNSAEVFKKLNESLVDVVILDISMPGRSGLETLKGIRKMKPDLPVLMLSMYPEEQYAVRAIKAGASGYLNKDSAPEELINALKIVSSGKRYINFKIAEQLANYFDQSLNKPKHEILSDREYEILIKIASGKTITDIASELSLSVKTISTYKTRLMSKLNLNGNNDLVRYVIEHKLSI